MTKREYLRWLKLGHQGEVLGEAAFGVAAQLARQPDRKRKWRALRALEAQTKDDLAAAIAREGDVAHELAVAKGLGWTAGILAASLPWRPRLRLLGVAARSTFSLFDRFSRELASHDARLFRRYLDHERASQEFVERELAGDERSLEPVERELAT